MEDTAIVLWDKTCNIPVDGADLQRVPAVTLERLLRGEEIPDAAILHLTPETLEKMHDGCEYEVRVWTLPK